MSFEARPPTEAETPPQQAPAELATTVLTPTDTGAVSRRSQGKTGSSTRKGRTAAKRKPEAKTPRGAKKAAKKVTSGQGVRKRGAAAAKKSGGWEAGPRVAGRKPSAAQKRTTQKTPARKSTAARTKRATTGRTGGTPTRTGKGTRTGSARTPGARGGRR